VIDGLALIEFVHNQTSSATPLSSGLGAPSDSIIGEYSTSTIRQTTPNPTILIVDDSVALRQTLALTLEKSSFRVLQARDGREAMERLQETSSIKLVICDIEMPNMNGFEFLSQRRANLKLLEIPIVMLTSRSSHKHRLLARQLGASAYFTKPYLEQDFLTTIKDLLKPTRKGVEEESHK
jgi:chemotaxis family two-component system sensor histidine kinase/response regulator PixL